MYFNPDLPYRIIEKVRGDKSTFTIEQQFSFKQFPWSKPKFEWRTITERDRSSRPPQGNVTVSFTKKYEVWDWIKAKRIPVTINVIPDKEFEENFPSEPQ